MKFAGLAVGGCLVLILAGCANRPENPADDGRTTVSAPAEAGAPDTTFAAFGGQRVWANGLSVTVSQPRSLEPSDASFPTTPRLAVFTVTLANGTDAAYRTSQLAVHAVVNGVPVAEVRDTLQGLNGIASAVAEVAPGGDATLTLAYAVPEDAVRLQLVVEPNGTGKEPSATFEGPA
ncbi:hypothetical protein GCM10022243_61330 [Saccharothrix violaceirubra]|uniref:DUF4352 domain-containing protein n=1 Tax=Saccharothrix violaceirubra TaxID=413306 RepID=A0A7W7T7P7_9PSEU|nr:hypothetical protein [Saccharothrix violaceirubra]MBB4968109.1 hypothetical protein [Saccharothrix violaceirubra]